MTTSRHWNANYCRRLAIGLAALALFIVFYPPADLHADDPTAAIEVLHSRDKYPAGGTYPILFKITISQGWNIHGIQNSEEGLIATRLTLEPLSDVDIIGPFFPPPQLAKFDYTTEKVPVFTGTIWVKAWIQIAPSHPVADVAIKGRFSFQACSDKLCRPPETLALNFPITIVEKGAVVARLNPDSLDLDVADRLEKSSFPGNGFNTGFWLTLLGIFLGGLALNLTPCIYPLIPITVSYFGGRSTTIQGHSVLHAVVYLAGLSLTNSLLGVSAALSGGMLGAALQSPLVLLFLAAIMMALALSFFGVWELRAPGFLTAMASKNYRGYFGTFFMGLTLGIVAAPCLGPFILGLLAYVGQTGDPFLGFLYFLVLSIGMGLPLCILALFSGALERLPRSGEWMVWVKKAMGWILVAVAAYIVKPLLPPTFVKDGLVFFVMIMAGIHLGWLDRSAGGLRGFGLIKKSLGVVVALAGILLMVFVLQSKERIAWQPYGPETLAAAKAAGRPVVLDFYADWCLPCKELDLRTFSDDRVVALSRHFAMLRLDLTRRQPDQDEILRRYRVRGVPTVIFFDSSAMELTDLRVEAFIKAEDFIVRMQRALEASAR